MHRPVLLGEVMRIFSPRPGQTYIDATINGGGHAFAILEKIGEGGTLLGIDRDCALLERLQTRIHKSHIPHVILACDNFAHIADICRRHHLAAVDGILFDLGVSAYHPEESGRGFSFLKEEPLDMRFSPKETTLTAEMIVNHWPREKIERLVREYGEERFAGRIADEIVRTRKQFPLRSTRDLVRNITRAVPRRYCRQRIHCATRTFQALRIAVNDELQSIEQGIRGAMDILSPGGMLIAISFHSLEDRIVKRLFRAADAAGTMNIITAHVIRPSRDEIRVNPRSRSAVLRAAQKIS